MIFVTSLSFASCDLSARGAIDLARVERTRARTHDFESGFLFSIFQLELAYETDLGCRNVNCSE